jgi:Fe-Mn family superoxide dismutase
MEAKMAFELPALPYAYNALEPVIDALTVEIHYSKHHATYAKNLNSSLEKYPQIQSKPLEEILSNLSTVPEESRTAVKNNGGGYYNHIQYWESFSPTGLKEPKGKLAEAITKYFGNFQTVKEQLEKAGLTRFGSGWAWLSKKPNGELIIHSTANQDSPLSEGLIPLLALDVWEHAYYLKYQNRRADYLAALWQIVDWGKVEKKYLA